MNIFTKVLRFLEGVLLFNIVSKLYNTNSENSYHLTCMSGKSGREAVDSHEMC